MVLINVYHKFKVMYIAENLYEFLLMHGSYRVLLAILDRYLIQDHQFISFATIQDLLFDLKYKSWRAISYDICR